MVNQQTDPVKDILDRCALVVFQTRVISAERDTGNTVRKGVKTVKETVTTFDAGVLKSINAEKQRGTRLCQQFGTKMESLAAWLVPNERVPDLMKELGAVRDKVADLTEDLAAKMGRLVEVQAMANRDAADQIRELGPKPDEVRQKTKIIFAAYRVRPDDIVADEGGFTGDIANLHMQAMHEFHMALKDAKANPDGDYFTQGIREVLGRIGTKASSLGFLHPVVAEIGSTVQSCLADLPKSGMINGYQAVALGSLISQLMEPRKLLERGGFTKLKFTPPVLVPPVAAAAAVVPVASALPAADVAVENAGNDAFFTIFALPVPAVPEVKEQAVVVPDPVSIQALPQPERTAQVVPLVVPVKRRPVPMF